MDVYIRSLLLLAIAGSLLIGTVLAWPSLQRWHRCETLKAAYREAKRDDVVTWDLAYAYQEACYAHVS